MDSADPVVNLNEALHYNLTLEEEDAMLKGDDNMDPKPTLLGKEAENPEDGSNSQQETLLVRAPRPICFGPPKNNNRWSRGSRLGKTQAKPGDTEVKNTPGKSSTASTNEASTGESSESTAQSNKKANQNAEHKAGNGPAPNNNGKSRKKKTIKRDKREAEQKPTGNVDNTVLADNQASSQGVKRPRSAGNSPAEQRNKIRKYADVVADDLRVLIVDKNNDLSIDQVSLLEEALYHQHDVYCARTPRKSPIFHDIKYMDGKLRLVCADLFSKQWLETAAKAMSPPWEGAELEVIPVPPKAKRPTIRFFVPNGLRKLDFPAILEKLRLQNPPLSTALWAAWKQDAKIDGVFYHVSVDDETVALIESKGNRLFYYFSKIKVITPPKKLQQDVINETVAEGANENENKE